MVRGLSRPPPTALPRKSLDKGMFSGGGAMEAWAKLVDAPRKRMRERGKPVSLSLYLSLGLLCVAGKVAVHVHKNPKENSSGGAQSTVARSRERLHEKERGSVPAVVRLS